MGYVRALGVNLGMNGMVNLGVSRMMNLGVGMPRRMLDMGVNPHDLSDRREADGARGDPYLQAIPSVGAQDVSFPHGCPSSCRTERIEQRPKIGRGCLPYDHRKNTLA